MSMRKTVNSKTHVIVAGGNEKYMYGKVFQYMVGSEIFTVMDSFTADNAEMRRVRREDGSVEDITLATLLTDLDISKNGGSEVKILKESQSQDKTED